MRQLSEIKGQDAIEVLGDILDPMVDILSDEEIQRIYGNGRNVDVVRYIMKHHSQKVLEIMAIIDGEDMKDYNPSLLDIPIKLMQLIRDPVFAQLFTSQAQNMESAFSGSATENTGATEAE